MTLVSATKRRQKTRAADGIATAALHAEIIKAYRGGMTPTHIAEVAGISRTRVHEIVRRDKDKG